MKGYYVPAGDPADDHVPIQEVTILGRTDTKVHVDDPRVGPIWRRIRTRYGRYYGWSERAQAIKDAKELWKGDRKHHAERVALMSDILQRINEFEENEQ